MGEHDVRNTILGTFRRGRPRNASQSHIIVSESLLDQPLVAQAGGSNNPGPALSARSTPNQQSATMNLSSMLRRRRSAGNYNTSSSSRPASPSAISVPSVPPPPPTPAVTVAAASSHHQSTQPTTTTHTSKSRLRIRLVPHLESRRALKFEPIVRDLGEGDTPLRLGRFTDRSGLGLTGMNGFGSHKIAFKSKVVSRAHAEIWVDGSGRFWVKDTKSSSGTFLNNSRLCHANTESRPFHLKDGDILQLGVDYQGGSEDYYRAVKIKIEIGRAWQEKPNAFNMSALKSLKNLANQIQTSNATTGTCGNGTGLKPGSSKKSSIGIPDCCICLFGITIHQALFVAPCTHTFHYKCVRPILISEHPSFSCPICRTYADLDEDVEVDLDDGGIWKDDGGDSSPEDTGGSAEGGGEGASPPPPVPPLPHPRRGDSSHSGGDHETDVEMDPPSPPPPPIPAIPNRFTRVLEEVMADDMPVDDSEGPSPSPSLSLVDRAATTTTTFEVVIPEDGGALLAEKDDHLHPDELLTLNSRTAIGSKRKR